MLKINYIIYSIIFLFLILNGFQKSIFSQKSSIEVEFEKTNNLPWKLAFEDDCTGFWQNNWVLDGERAHISHSTLGMDYFAGHEAFNDTCHTVLWTKQNFSGNVKIEYDYTRIDTSTLGVNIIYILATGSGKGAYKKNILEWNELRRIPAMKQYYNHMNTYHISYAAFPFKSGEPEYIRARRYLPETGKGLEGTALKPEYANDSLFVTDVRHHISIIKSGNKLFMKVSNPTQTRFYWFDTSNLPNLESGRIGLRQMWTRAARYANFKVYVLKN